MFSPVASDDPQGVAVPIAWIGPEEIPILHVNAFISQFDPQTLDALVLTVGQMTHPAISGGTTEEREEQVRNVAFVPIKPIVRLALTPARAIELIATLQANLDQLDHAKAMRPEDPRS